MAYWRIGVAVFMSNNSFKYGHRIGAEDGYGTVSGATTILYGTDTIDGETNTDSQNLIKFLKAGDSLLIGPSTFSGYEGQTDRVTVTSVTTNTVNFTPATTAYYNNGDPITGIGTNTPAGWFPENTSNITMGGISDHTQRTLSTMDGNLDRFSVQMKGSASGDRYVYSDLNLDDFLSNAFYKVGCYYQYFASPTDDGSCKIQLRADGSSFINSTMTSSNVTTWTEHIATSARAPASPEGEWEARLTVSNATSGYGILNVDNIFVEHAASTDGDSNGVYTFTDYPDLNSRKFKVIKGSSMYRLHNHSIKVNDFTGAKDASKKYIVSASYSDVAKSIRENLETLMSWQDRGKYLILHHDISTAPPNIQGILKITDTSLANWSSGLCSFNLSFEEA